MGQLKKTSAAGKSAMGTKRAEKVVNFLKGLFL
jgi:hypothetical protein